MPRPPKRAHVEANEEQAQAAQPQEESTPEDIEAFTNVGRDSTCIMVLNIFLWK